MSFRLPFYDQIINLAKVAKIAKDDRVRARILLNEILRDI
jgi:hypothetical protein